MKGSTILKFSKQLITKLPGIAQQTYSASQGEFQAWLRTSANLIGSVSDLARFGIERNNMKKIQEKVDTAKKETKKQLDEFEHRQLNESYEVLKRLREDVEEQRKLFEEYLATLRTENMRKKTDFQAEKEKDKQQLLEELEFKSKAELDLLRDQAADADLKRMSQLEQKEMNSKLMQTVRRDLQQTADLFDEKIKKESFYKELSDDEKTRYSSIRRTLQWQINRNIDI